MDGSLFFQYQNMNYIFKEIFISNDEINDLYNLSVFLNNKGVRIHSFVFNKDKKIYTESDNRKFVLLLMHINKDNNITFDDLLNFKNLYIYYKGISWNTLWSKKIDYFESEIKKYRGKFHNVYIYFDYFVGLAEIGIQLLSLQSYTDSISVVCHKRLSLNMKIKDLYDPFNIVIDKVERDYAELYKDAYFKGIYYDVMKFIKTYNISNIYLFFIRLLYITPFFDLFDSIINSNYSFKKMYSYTQNENYNNNQSDNKYDNLNKIINNSNIYINELKKVYKYLYDNNMIVKIDFLL